MGCKLFFLSAFIVTSINSYSQNKNVHALPNGCIQLTPGEMIWIDTLSSLPKGTAFCLLYGDIKKEGAFAVRLKLPPNLYLKTHYHPKDEVVTVLGGSISVGFAADSSLNGLKEFKSGSFYVNGRNIEHHIVVGPAGATIQINSMGPWEIIFK